MKTLSNLDTTVYNIYNTLQIVFTKMRSSF